MEGVLRFSRAEAGTRALHPEAKDVAGEVRDAVRAFSPLATAAGVEVRTRLEDRCIALVEPDTLRQVLLNLLDNAVKFGPEGQRVTVSVARAGGEIIVSVADEGRGIPESERRTVFAPFAQGTTSRSRTTTGAGIGLAVVADLVAEHRGRVWIDDAPGHRGALVCVALPACDAEGRMPTDVPTFAERSRGRVEALAAQ